MCCLPGTSTNTAWVEGLDVAGRIGTALEAVGSLCQPLPWVMVGGMVHQGPRKICEELSGVHRKVVIKVHYEGTVCPAEGI